MITDPQVVTAPMISQDDFARVAALLKRMTGIHIASNKRAMVSGRLSKRLKAAGIGSVSAYCDWLQRPGNSEEEDAFVSALTTNMTRFNREPHHFAHLGDQLLPGLVRAARNGQRVRLWSTACSTGEEAYDLALRVLDACPDAARRDLRILATDIDKAALATARAGIYPAASLTDLPDDLSARFFRRAGAPAGMVRVDDAARALVSFRQLNLNAEWPFQGLFDVVICRNVTIYFDETTQARLWRRLADRVAPGGALYIGHSELLPEMTAARFRQEGHGAFRLAPAAPPHAAHPHNATIGPEA